MDRMEEIYKQLTQVDIEEQKKIWDERGRGYYGEFVLFCRLYKSIQGNFKILMNLNLPTEDGKTTEIDLLMIHETGIYVFEVKHHKGIIYGTDEDPLWTQYFKTASNHTFHNPIEQNGYHVRALKNLFPEEPISSVIVFTNNDCEIRVNNQNPYIDICKLDSVNQALAKRFQKQCLSVERIEEIFQTLAKYSPMQEPAVLNGETAPFGSWLEPTIVQMKAYEKESQKKLNELTEKVKELENQKKSNKVVTICTIVISILSAILCITIGCCIIDAAYDSYYTEKIKDFEHKFLHVDEIDNPYIDELSTYVTVSDALLSPLTADAVEFSAKINLTTKAYCVLINKDAKYIVMTQDGKVREYDVFDESSHYMESSNRLNRNYYSPSLKLEPARFYGINDPSQIVYVKIIGVTLEKTDFSHTDIKDDLEIKLYQKF
ncbi:MAG: NERD domain-containing protein [Clostridia bacterium]|nr:NERD domain-containing protein [Clostridia bacterium]